MSDTEEKVTDIGCSDDNVPDIGCSDADVPDIGCSDNDVPDIGLPETKTGKRKLFTKQSTFGIICQLLLLIAVLVIQRLTEDIHITADIGSQGLLIFSTFLASFLLSISPIIAILGIIINIVGDYLKTKLVGVYNACTLGILVTLIASTIQIMG